MPTNLVPVLPGQLLAPCCLDLRVLPLFDGTDPNDFSSLSDLRLTRFAGRPAFSFTLPFTDARSSAGTKLFSDREARSRMRSTPHLHRLHTVSRSRAICQPSRSNSRAVTGLAYFLLASIFRAVQ